MQEGDTIGALESRLKMFDMYNEYTGKGIICMSPVELMKSTGMMYDG